MVLSAIFLFLTMQPDSECRAELVKVFYFSKFEGMMHVRDAARFIKAISESKAPQDFAMKIIEYEYKCLLYTELKFKSKNLLCMGFFVLLSKIIPVDLKLKFKPFGTFLSLPMKDNFLPTVLKLFHQSLVII